MAGIIVVEDSAPERGALVSLLQGGGHVLHTAATAAEAIALLEHTRVDIVLFDLNLSDGSGIQGLIEIRAAAPEIQIVVVSAFADLAHSDADLFELGADAYVPKPVELSRLRIALQRVAPRKASGVLEAVTAGNVRERDTG